ncbi:MAG: PTS sugar transporter subunit IIA [Candidatus Fermentibacteraceae bacterium]|nr:PTS sugar transporter subunit IIA [Candidatus Fermentibacteraceae bacterium]
MSTRLSEMLNPACIELELAEKKKPEIIRELIDLVSRAVDIPDREAMYEALMERERLSSTGIGNGIAIPHCLTDQVETTRVAFARKLDGAKFDSVDNQPVALFFLLVGPENNPNLHLQVLSKLARYLHDGIFCDHLLAAGSPEEVIKAFRSKEQL